MENPLHNTPGFAVSWLVHLHESATAVIPCLNEEGSIADVVERTKPFVSAVFVVDDGSSDATSERAEAARAKVLRHAVNLGKGASIRDGLQAARDAGFGWAALLDGDGQHDPADIPKLFEAARSGADLVIGDRGAAIGVTPVRAFVNRWMSQKLSKRIGLGCPDSQSGFRLVRLSAWAGLTFRANRFEVESEMLVAFARAGLKIAFVPVRCLPAGRPSRIRPVRDTIRWLRWWLGNR